MATPENVNNGGYESMEGDSIKVFVRVRPPAKTLEQDVDHSLCLEVTSSKSLVLFSKPEPKQFSYDHVADMNTTQEEVFSTVGKKIIEGCVYGYNGTIFAYGQTGSGKTFTMLGPPDDSDNFSHELRGVIPRGFEYMFSLINREQEKHGDRKEFICKCSFLEIYNEQIFDLLDPASVGLHLREDIKKGVFVEGLQERDIISAKDAYKVLTSGWMNRRVASTSMNRESSRSHAVFTVSIQSKEKKGGIANIKVSRLHLVDLAGSERQKDTRTEGVRLKEAGNINRSLSALGNVIMALVDIAHGKTRHVHYRDSKLTFILRDSLGGNAKTYIIANIHPSAKCFGETLSTLNFARRAKMIKNKAIINEDITGNVTELQMEIKKLKDIISQLKAGVVPEGGLKEDSEEAETQEGKPYAEKRKTGSDEKAQQWKELMLNAVSEREKAEQEKQVLQDKVQKLEEMCSRKDKFLQSTKMIVKLRESYIAKLERMRKKEKGAEGEEEDTKDREMKLLREEIKILQDKIEHHPEVTRFALENLELRAELKKLKTMAADNAFNDSNNNEMVKAHRYTLQLERQIRDLMASSHGNDSEKSLSSSLQSLEASNAEVDRLKASCTQFQTKYEASQQDLAQSRQEIQQAREELIEQSEKARRKELELQSDLVAAKKSISELERALESFQLKTAVERTTMNDIHMQTIKTLTSPQRLGTPIRFGSTHKSTPLRTKDLKNASMNGTPKKNLFNNDSTENTDSNIIDTSKSTTCQSGTKQNGTLPRRDSLNDIEDEDEENPFFDFHSETKDAEEIYTEAMMEELKQLQAVIDEHHENLKNEKSKVVKVNQINAKLQHQVNELNELLSKERSSWNTKEFEINSQITGLSRQFKEEQDEKQLLKSEVEDLRILIQAADKEVDSLKRARNNDAIEGGRRYAGLESKLVKIESNYYNLQNELDETAQLNQQLQSDLETCREELQFTNHKNRELEIIVSVEREKVKNLDGKLKNALERLEIEIETNLKLTQEDKQTEVMRALEESKELRDQLDQLNSKCKLQETTMAKIGKERDEQIAEVVRLSRVNESENEAVSNLRKCVQDLRGSLSAKENELEQMSSQLDESKRMFNELTAAYDEKKKKISRLNEALKQESNMLEKERSEKDVELKLLREELQVANDQYKELSVALEQQQSQLTPIQTELADERQRVKNLEEQIEEFNEMHKESIVQYEKRLTDIHDLVDPKDLSVVDSQAEEMGRMKVKLTEFVKLSENWENDRQDKNVIIAELKEQIVGYEDWKSEKLLYEEKHKLLEDEIEMEKKARSEREASLNAELGILKKNVEAKNEQYMVAAAELEQCKEMKKKVDIELAMLKGNLDNAQEDIDYMQGELERTRKHEEKVFEEKEELKSQLSVVMEEKTKLSQTNDELTERAKTLEAENAKLASHQNLNQKIKHHLNLKKENNQLKEQISKLSIEVVHWKNKAPKT
ncbi:kinesin-like protein KIF15 isoform X2 [Rhopilema esculentum]|uniref:kinesin-like protein KIF15 isoform X2 n=1 Tax=Rhopilema esculentum TaxID=499914 RepID=UPI0031DB332A